MINYKIFCDSIDLTELSTTDKSHYESKVLFINDKYNIEFIVKNIEKNTQTANLYNLYNFNNLSIISYVKEIENKLIAIIAKNSASWFGITDQDKLLKLFKSNIIDEYIRCEIEGDIDNNIENINKKIKILFDKVVFEKDKFYIPMKVKVDDFIDNCGRNDFYEYEFNDDSEDVNGE